MYGKIKDYLQQQIKEIKDAGLYKNERLIESPQGAEIQVGGKTVLNFCANNYLGLSDNPRLIKASKDMMDRRGFGMSSVPQIKRTDDIPKPRRSIISLEALIRRGLSDRPK
jgi:glycine C-acetyltransferase